MLKFRQQTKVAATGLGFKAPKRQLKLSLLPKT